MEHPSYNVDNFSHFQSTYKAFFQPSTTLSNTKHVYVKTFTIFVVVFFSFHLTSVSFDRISIPEIMNAVFPRHITHTKIDLIDLIKWNFIVVPSCSAVFYTFIQFYWVTKQIPFICSLHNWNKAMNKRKTNGMNNIINETTFWSEITKDNHICNIRQFQFHEKEKKKRTKQGMTSFFSLLLSNWQNSIIFLAQWSSCTIFTWTEKLHGTPYGLRWPSGHKEITRTNENFSKLPWV